MKRSLKILLGVLVVLFLALLGLLMSINAAEKTLPKELVYPASTLSDSIFASQNNKYSEAEGFAYGHKMKTVPYIINTPTEEGATVEDVGTIFTLGADSPGYYMFTTEYNADIDVNGFNTLKEQLSAAILLGSDVSLSKLENMASGVGYINGLAAVYHADHLTAYRDGEQKEVFITAYSVDIPDSSTDMIVAFLTEYADSNALNFCKQFLDRSLVTCRFDGGLKAEQDSIRAQMEEQEASQLSQSTSGDLQGQLEQPVKQQAAVEKYLAVDVSTDYQSLVVYFNYSKAGAKFEATLYNADKTQCYPTVRNADGVAIFNVGRASAGRYILEIKGEDYGEGSVQLSNNASITNTETNTEAGAQQTDSSNDNTPQEDTTSNDAE